MAMIAKLTTAGERRVLDGKAGMTFIVARITEGRDGRRVAHVYDYRFPCESLSYQMWSLGPEDYQLVTP